ncbi:MAG TPA: PDZ domain-containing protein [Blastocatellia bacterium]|jgi:predicted metalloprotease with PDZ domain|nr:PDZ domain-containing protein [Blastocatellia bacterium]
MLERKKTRTLILFVATWLIPLTAPSALGQTGEFRIDYTVTVADLGRQLFHVTADVKNIKEPRLDISLPTWTPGWYTVENYAKNILRFTITDAGGARLLYTMPRKQTWRVDTKGLGRIKIDFDYRADVLALNQAKIANDFAFFTGIELFVMAEGHRDSPSGVRFEVPAGWRIVSALKETADPKTFTAPDYDTLVDAPTQMGNFDVTKFEVEGKPHYLLTTPAGKFAKDKAEKFADLLAKTARSQSAIFGGLPYDKYVYFYFFLRPESNAGGALEHLNSHVAFAPPPDVATPEMIIGTASHEFFHLWNVKRIRPAEMWPYDYSRENETPLLWVSEGFTNYYGAIALYRAGIRTRAQFLQNVEGAIGGVEGNEARKYISPANASSSTWLGYDTPVAFGISYYTQGQNLGALLDLSMLHDTAGRSGLDDVMRALYRDYYQKGKGFSTADMISIINNLTKRDYNDFYRRYVWGVEVPPYDAILGYAGYKVEQATSSEPELGIEASVGPGGGIQVTRVHPGTSALTAGLQPGDVLVSFDGVEVRRGFGAVYERLVQKVGKSIKIVVTRGGENKTLEMQVVGREQVGYKITEMPQPTPDQLKVRESWLKVNKQ